ncbi:PKD domain-containing protein [Haladaptatus sp. NG-WS-4]
MDRRRIEVRTFDAAVDGRVQVVFAGVLDQRVVDRSTPASDSTTLSRDSFTIQSGTEDETDVFVTKANESGPTAMVVGGIHGNEDAGYESAERIAEWDIERGTLVAIPKANAEAVEDGTRNSDDGTDLNRQFPTGEEPETELARAIWGIVEEYEPDVVVGLHESTGIYDGDIDGGVGQVIFSSWDDKAFADAESAVKYLNGNYVSRDEYEFETGAFSSSDSEPAGLIVHKAARDADAFGFLAEVTSQDTSLSKRVMWHEKIVQQLVEEEVLTSSDDGNSDEDEEEKKEEKEKKEEDEKKEEQKEEEKEGEEKEGEEKEENEPPVAKIQTSADNLMDGSLEQGQTLTFDASKSKDSDGKIVTYQWDLDGDGSFETSGKTAEMTLSKCGSYRVTLQVTDDDDGAKATDEVTLTTV